MMQNPAHDAGILPRQNPAHAGMTPIACEELKPSLQNPAHAGMNLRSGDDQVILDPKPRSRGDEPMNVYNLLRSAVKTPLTRG